MNKDVGFQDDLQSIIRGLDHPNRQEIIKVLVDHKRMSFSEIQKTTNINSSLLSNHLNNLVENLLVDRFYDHISDRNSYSYYELSPVGRRIVTALENTLYGGEIEETPIVS